MAADFSEESQEAAGSLQAGVRPILTLTLPWRRTLVGCSILMLAQSATVLSVPWIAGQFAAGLLAGGQPGMKAGGLMLVMLIALFALQSILQFSSHLLLGRTAEAIIADLRTRLYDHLQALPLDYFQRQSRGDLLSLLTEDVARLAHYLSGPLPGALPLAATVAGAWTMMAWIDPALALLVLAAVPMFWLLLKVMGRRLRPLAGRVRQAYAASMAVAEENLSLLPAIKTFTREADESKRYRSQVERLRQLSQQEHAILAAMGPAVQFLAAAGMVLLLGMLGSGETARSPSEMMTFLLYVAVLTRPVGSLADLYGQTRKARGAVERIAKVLVEPPEHDTGLALSPVRGTIEFRGVCFAYPGRADVLNNLNLRIAAGETVAITGQNGSGKSTLTHLLMRLIEPSSGQVLIDDRNIAQVSIASLRGQIGVVSQHVLLANASVRENIAWGRPDATDAEIESAARAAQAHDFVIVLPQGYDTPIGEQGVRLSGGQRQRIALARALLKNPPILVLDEATAMFDPESEQTFVAQCRHTLAHRTVILITHREASLAVADRVLRLRGGRVEPAGRTLEVVEPTNA